MRYLFFLIFLIIGSSFVYADVCNSTWLQNRTKNLKREEIKSFLQSEGIGDVHQVCNGYNDRPLHLALMSNSRFILIIALVETIVETGGDLCAENTEGQTPLTIIEEKYYNPFSFDILSMGEELSSHTPDERDLRELYLNTQNIYTYIRNRSASICEEDQTI